VKVKANSSQIDVMKAYEGADVSLRSFLTSSLNADKSSDLRYGRFTPEKLTSVPSKSLVSVENRTPSAKFRSPVAIPVLENYKSIKY
jgi:hypothetical protein